MVLPMRISPGALELLDLPGETCPLLGIDLRIELPVANLVDVLTTFKQELEGKDSLNLAAPVVDDAEEAEVTEVEEEPAVQPLAEELFRFEVPLQAEHDGFGLDLFADPSEGLVIVDVSPGGAVATYNSTRDEEWKIIRPGFRIVRANSETNAAAMLEMIRQPRAELRLTLAVFASIPGFVPVSRDTIATVLRKEMDLKDGKLDIAEDLAAIYLSRPDIEWSINLEGGPRKFCSMQSDFVIYTSPDGQGIITTVGAQTSKRTGGSTQMSTAGAEDMIKRSETLLRIEQMQAEALHRIDQKVDLFFHSMESKLSKLAEDVQHLNEVDNKGQAAMKEAFGDLHKAGQHLSNLCSEVASIRAEQLQHEADWQQSLSVMSSDIHMGLGKLAAVSEQVAQLRDSNLRAGNVTPADEVSLSRAGEGSEQVAAVESSSVEAASTAAYAASAACAAAAEAASDSAKVGEDSVKEENDAQPDPKTDSGTAEDSKKSTVKQTAKKTRAELLEEEICKRLEKGPLQLGKLSHLFSKSYNAIYHNGKAVNNGSWSKWLSSLPRVDVETDDTGRFSPHCVCSLALTKLDISAPPPPSLPDTNTYLQEAWKTKKRGKQETDYVPDPRLFKLEKGMSLAATSEGYTYTAEVAKLSFRKEHAAAPVKIHYCGYTQESDEWVHFDRLRTKAITGMSRHQ